MNDTEPPSPHPTRGTAGFALSQQVPMNLLFIVLMFAGVLAVKNMPVDVYPDVSLDEATINTFWLGASAEDIERLVTDQIEDKVLDIRGVERVISDSKPDLSRIRVKFRESLSDTELDAAFRQLRAAVDQVTDLPEDAHKPVVTKISVAEVFFLLWIVVEDTGDVGEQVLHDVAYQLKSVLRDVPGVSKVDDKFIRDREIHILADRDALRKFGLTLQDLSDLLMQYNRNLPSGTLSGADGELSVRAAGGVTDPDQLGSTVVLKNPRGGHVTLRDVARIVPAFERRTLFPRYDLHECLSMGIAKTYEADSRRVAADVRAALDAFTDRLPPGVRLTVADDASDIIRSRLHVLTSNLAWGIALVFLVLWVTVGARNAGLAIVGIPFSFFCALIAMHVTGVTINAVSLIGLVLCTGMIVDDAVVVLENIYTHVERVSRTGPARLTRARLYRAIVDGTAEVMWPVISSSATTVAAFLPLLIMTGVTGEFFSIIPKTVTIVLAASLFECLLILPVHYLDWGPRGRKRRPSPPPDATGHALRDTSDALPGTGDALPDTSDIGVDGDAVHPGVAARAYQRLLGMMLRHRYAALLPLLASGYLAVAAFDLVGVELFPSDFQHCMIDVQTADEASLEQTARAVEPIERLALDLGPDRVPGVLTWLGLLVTDENDVKLRNNVAQVHVQLTGNTTVGADSSAVAAELRGRIRAYLDAHPEAPIESFRVWAPQSGPPVGKPVSIRIECPDFATSKTLAEAYKAKLRSMPGVHGIRDNLDFGQQQVNLRIDENRASVHGLTFLALAGALRAANDGIVVSTFKDTRTGEDLDVRLMLDEPYRRTLTDLMDLDVRAGGGYVIQAGRVASLDITQGFAGIPHTNGRRVVTVGAQVDPRVTTAKDVNEAIEAAFAPRLDALPNVRVVYGGEYAETVASFTSLKEAYLIAIVVIYVLLASQFRSYVQPFIIIALVPFACVGVVFGLLVSDYPFTIMTFIGVVGMTGVVVNDSILLVDCINQHRRRGHATTDALRLATLRRVRPILLTTVTTVAGLAPLALGIGGVSKIWSPFASSFAWGLALSTGLTLFYIPVAYAIVQDARGAFRRTNAEAPEAPPRRGLIA